MAEARLRDQDLTGKVALITGTSRGIGRAIALNLASRGCSILGTCSSTSSLHLIDTLSHTVSQLYRGSPDSGPVPRVVGLAADILSPSTPFALAEGIEKHFGGHVDICVNNAAITTIAPIGAMEDEHIDEYLTGNIAIPVKIVEQLVRRKQFRKNSRIVCISSVRARKPWANQYALRQRRLAGRD